MLVLPFCACEGCKAPCKWCLILQSVLANSEQSCCFSWNQTLTHRVRVWFRDYLVASFTPAFVIWNWTNTWKWSRSKFCTTPYKVKINLYPYILPLKDQCLGWKSFDVKLKKHTQPWKVHKKALTVLSFWYYQGRRQRYGRYGHGRTGFLRKKNGVAWILT